MPFANMNSLKFAVVGAGRSGRAAARLLHSLGADVRLLEKNTAAIPDDFDRFLRESGIKVLGGEHTPSQFEGADIVIPSPGAAKAAILPLLPAKKDGSHAEIMAETELAWRLLDGEPVIGVTGTSGKTTTVSICSAMLEQHGLDVFTGGNIGTPLSEYVLARRTGRAKADVIVLELSSFQLQTCSTLRPHVGILLNISENHLDFHKDMQEYIDAKMQMFACQTPEDLALLAPGLSGLPECGRIRARLEFLPSGTAPFPDTRLIGAHNQSNAEAAFRAAAVFGVTREEAAAAMKDFTPIAHRLESAGESNGVRFVNDSKCTTIEALRVALQSFTGPVILLAGGKFKGGDLEGIKPLLRQHVRHIALYGSSREHFEPAWKDTVPVTWDETMDEALERACAMAVPGDSILLSPATSSFDQYRNYVERGNHFKELVTARIASHNGRM